MPIQSVVLLAALAAPIPARQDSITSTLDLYPSEVLVERGSERWLCHRLVDDLTGRPIAGAELFLVDESMTPIDATFWSTRSAKSDADGFVRVRLDDVAGREEIHIVRAPGFATSARFGPGDVVWRLAPPQDVPVLVRDWLGRSVAGARISFCGSCGHGPDLASATSDANGIALLRGIDPHESIRDLYCQARGLGLGYESLRWSPGDAPYVLTCIASTPITGKLLDPASKPVVGAFVGVQGVDRGPWCVTDASGGFEVLGADEGSPPVAIVDGRHVDFPRARAYPTVLRVPASSTEPYVEGSVDDPAVGPAPDLELASIELRVEDPRTIAQAWLPNGAFSQLKDGRVEVPKSGPFALQVGARHVAYASLADLPPQPVVLIDFPPTLLRGRVSGPKGESVGVRATLRLGSYESWPSVVSPDGTFDLETRATGTVLLEIEPAPGHAELRPHFAHVALPHRGDGAAVDLGRIVLAREPQLRVLAADGSPRTDADVAFARPGFAEIGEEPLFPLDSAGGWLGPELRAGDVLIVTPRPNEDDGIEARFVLPFRTVLAGEAPWSIDAPAGVLDLGVRGLERGGDLATVVIGDQVLEISVHAEIVGVPPGSIRFFVSAPGRRTAIVETTIPATGKKTLDVELERL